jgi:ABC-type bacteriocin/lantibiotic exporter with double-glycine peptidase domain
VLQANEITFGYSPENLILKGVNFDVGLDSRVAIVGANGAGKSLVLPFLRLYFIKLTLVRVAVPCMLFTSVSSTPADLSSIMPV